MSKTHVYLSKEAAAIVDFKDAELAEAKASHEITAEQLHASIMALAHESECVEAAKAALEVVNANNRAERAETECKALRELLDWIYGFLAYMDSYHSRMIRDKVRAAILNPTPAETK